MPPPLPPPGFFENLPRDHVGIEFHEGMFYAVKLNDQGELTGRGRALSSIDAAVKDAEEWADEYELKCGIRIFAKGERACVNITRQSSKT